jgi:arginyl-tRNA synthetase
MQDRERNIVFDWDKALAFEGNSGPYIQYAYVRAKKISNQGVHTDTYVSEKFSVENDKYILSLYDTALIRTLADMNSTIQKVASTYKPHTLALYCYDLAVCFNAFYTHTPKILDEENVELRQVRLSLCSLVSQKLHIGFALLGMGMPGEM